MKPISIIFLAGCLVALIAAPAAATTPETPDVKIKLAPLTQNQVWSLLQGSGAQLYGNFCASCHGLDGKGNATVARALGEPAPDLTRLKEAGVTSKHVAYVLRSSCDEEHHRAPDGTATMPCWQSILRNSLGTDTAAFMVTNRLVDHLDSIQVTGATDTSAATAPGEE